VKLLLIGWDAADWSLIQSLLDRGMMPRLEHLLSVGVLSELAPVRPFDSAAMWTSLFTGQRATAHGVLTPVEVDPTGARIQPTSRWTLTARPVWSLLSAAGYRVQAYGWPATHPAEPLNGVVVSDQFAAFGDNASIHPPTLAESLRGLRLKPAEIHAASLVTLVPRAGELNLVGDQRLFLVAQFLASTASLHAAATWGLQHEPWDFAAVRYDGLARLARVFGAAYTAAQAGEQIESAAMFGDLLPNAYRFFDMLLGRLLDLAGRDSAVMLIAASSQTSTARAHDARPESWRFIAGGPTVESSEEPVRRTICDVLPMIVRMFDLSSEPALQGSASPRLDLQDADNELVDPREVRTQEPPATAEADESVAHLLALGYDDQPDEFLRVAIKQLERERQLRLAETLIESGEYTRAAPVLAQLLQADPRSTLYRSMLAEVHFYAGHYDACRALILELQAAGLQTPLGHIALAGLDFLQQTGNAVEHLRRAEALGGTSARQLEIMGRLYLGLRRRVDAARVLDAALAMEPGRASAHISRASAYLYSGDAASAERHAHAAIELNPQSFEARYQLGLALASQDRFDNAIEAIKTGIALDCGDAAWAHGRLADLLDRRGDHALALHHRALYDRRGAASRRSQLDLKWFSEELMQ
jgi:tetratricopeptide (TPR) repeat protein